MIRPAVTPRWVAVIVVAGAILWLQEFAASQFRAIEGSSHVLPA